MPDIESALVVQHGDNGKERWRQVREYVELTDTGLLWLRDEALPTDLYGALCLAIGKTRKAARWWAGDALLYGDRSEDYAQYEDLLGVSPSTLDQYRRVAARIPYEERDPDVNWTAYQITAHLEPETREGLVEQYVSGEIEDTTELRDEVRALGGDQGACDLLPACPRCEGKLTSRKCKGCGMDFASAVRWVHDLLRKRDEARHILLTGEPPDAP